MKNTKNKKINVMLLGGAEEIGINCTVVENGNDIIIIDMGFGFPGDEMYGVDYLIPNVEYLKKNKDRIRGIVITHGHMDHIGGLAYVLEDLGFPPVYSRKLTIELIRPKLEEFRLDKKTKLHVIATDDIIKLGGTSVSFFGVNHNIPESVGVGVHTDKGVIVHTGDYKFDDTPVNEPITEYGKLCDLGKEGVLLAMCDSTNSMKKGRSISESSVTETLESTIRGAKGRVVVATFSSMITRVGQLMALGAKYNRKIAISGRSMVETVEIAKKLGYIKTDSSHFIKPSDASKYPDKQVMFICTGSQGEEMGALARMARKEHRDLSVKKGDTILLSSSVIPGNDIAIQRLIDDLIILGADVVHQALMDVHAGGHAYEDDQKLLINMLQPQFFMPIEGPLTFLVQHAKTAVKVGVARSRIIIPQNGQIYSYDGNKFVKKEKIASDPILVSGKSIGGVGEHVLREREQLANNGMIVLGINLDQFGKLVEPVRIASHGFVYSDTRDVLESDVNERVDDVLRGRFGGKKEVNSKDLQDLGQLVKKGIGKMIRKNTNRDPVILPVFV